MLKEMQNKLQEDLAAVKNDNRKSINQKQLEMIKKEKEVNIAKNSIKD